MNRWGVGIKFACFSLVFAAAAFIVNYFLYPELTISSLYQFLSFWLGVALASAGVLLFIVALFQLHLSFKNGKLQTRGAYAIVRHPIYASWIVLIVPGLVLISDLLIAALVPVLMFFVFKLLIRQEEHDLREKFGSEYDEYRRRVGALFPDV